MRAGHRGPGRRGGLCLAVLRGLPDRRADRRGPPGAGAADRRRAARPAGDGRRGDRPDPAGPGVHAEQPDRAGRARRRAARVPRPGAAATSSSSSTRPTPSSSGTPRPSTGWRCTGTAPTSSCCAPSPRPTGWLGCGWALPSRTRRSPTALRKTAVPFGVSTVAQAAAIASLRAEDALRERVAALVAERDRVHRRWPRRAGSCRTARPTSSGSGSVRPPRTSPPPARRPASWCARTARRACG